MKVAYFDCFSGIAGDMILGALIDLGVDINYLKREISKLGLAGYNIDVKKVNKNNIVASDVYITVDEKQPHRTLTDINKIIGKSSLNQEVKDLSKKIFLKLAEAEGKVHKVDVEKVHFHEVGAVDSIIDIIGAAIGVNILGITEFYCSSLPLGSGYVICQHGKIPLPAPATRELLKDAPTYQTNSGHEMVTPTGAAVITTICSNFGDMPSIKIDRIGYGAGKIKSSQKGVLKVVIGDLEKK